MPQKKFFRLSRKTVSGDLDFKKYISNIGEINKNSYNEFLQQDLSKNNRENIGLEKIFRNFFPIHHSKPKMIIEYAGYIIESPRLTPEDCSVRGINYGGSLRVFFKVTNLQTEEIHNIESCLGEIPLMTESGTFIINGHEKVFVGQTQKCPGIIFSKEEEPISHKKYAVAKIFPSLGSWLHIKCEKYLSISVDKKKKFGIVTFLLCFWKNLTHDGNYTLGYDIKEILDEFYPVLEIKYKDNFWIMPFNREKYKKIRLCFDVYVKGKKILKKGEMITNETYELLDVKEIQIPYEHLFNLFLAEDIYDSKTGEIFCEIGENVALKKLDIVKAKGKVKIYEINNEYPGHVLYSLQNDKITTKDEALTAWASSIKIGIHYGAVGLCLIFNTRFSDKKYYDLEEVGRQRLNAVLGLKKNDLILTFEDLVQCVKQILLLHEDKRKEDNIDSLANKRFIGVGKIVESFFRAGLIKFEKNLRDRICNLEQSSTKTSDIFNLKICLYAVLDGFYRSAQMFDNNNALSGKSHINKVNSVSQGLGKERVASGLRDLNSSQFGRTCAVQTPEGKKTGVVWQLTLYAKIDKYGFILTPYHEVQNAIASDKIIYLNSSEEEGKIISSKRLYKKIENEEGATFEPKSEYLVGRDADRTDFFHKSQVDLINVAENQIFGLSASLVPFPGNTDSYRMLSASNMNTQAVPLLKAEAPFVGTGMEYVLGEKIIAKNAGIVKYVDCTRIVVELENNDEIVDLYTLIFNKKTNAETSINYRPLVDIGDYVKAGDVIADGFSTINSEIALGKNLLVCFMSHPHCYEDAFVLSEKLIAEDLLTSIHIQSHSCIVYETRNGPEKNTKDVPRIHGELLKNLDECGVINIGAQVKGGDILVGKISPSSSEANLSSEYKLLNIIFGEKASEYTDSSMRLPHGCDGYVTEVKIINRKGVEKDGRTLLQDKMEVDKINNEFAEQIEVIKKSLVNKIQKLTAKSPLLKNFNGQIKGSILEFDLELTNSFISKKVEIPVEESVAKKIDVLIDSFQNIIKRFDAQKQKKINVLKYGYDLPDGVLKIITIFVATKKVIEAGDKLCGRYGNKGVISEIYPISDMPYLEDGTPIDMIISPFGLLSRMNFGQVLETTVGYGIFEMRKRLEKLLIDYHNGNDEAKIKARDNMITCLSHLIEMDNLLEIGFTSNKLNKFTENEILDLCKHFVENGIRLKFQQFAKFTEEEMNELLKKFNADISGKVEVYDGKTGEKFFGKVLVGYQFIMKLCHLVSKKMHARSIGPYSLINQQPLGGKSRFGGQKCGEMEVWALEAHGAAFNCHELLTVKSDDQKGRNRLFSHLTKVQRYGLVISASASAKKKFVGESCKLLMYELRAAGFNLFLINVDTNEEMEIGG